MSAHGASEGVTRRDALRLLAAGGAAAALPTVAAQDGNTTDGSGGETDVQFNFPENTITSENQGGSHAVLTESLGDAEIQQDLGHLFSGAGLGDIIDSGGTEGVPALIQESILMMERSQQNDQTFLSQLYNMMNRARTFALVRGKAVAIQNINNGATEQETIDGATTEVDQQYTLIQNNFLNAWTTRVHRIEDQQNKLDDAGHLDSFYPEAGITADTDNYTISDDEFDPGFYFSTREVTLADGSTTTTDSIGGNGQMAYQEVSDTTFEATWTVAPTGLTIDYSDPPPTWWKEDYLRFIGRTLDADPEVTSGWGEYASNSPTTKSGFESSNQDWEDLETGLGETFNQWMILWDWIEQQHADVQSNIEAYASEAYTTVESGEIDVQGLVSNSPAVMAQEWSTDYDETGHYSFAAASLGASGVSYDYENEMTIELEDGSTLTGTLYVNAEDYSFSVGDTVNPNGVPGMIQFAYASDSARRELEDTGDYRTAVEGGQVQLHMDPNKSAEYLIETAAGEQATIQGSDWEPVSPSALYNSDYSTNWKATADLEQGDTEISTMTVRRADSESSGGNIIEITQPFTIVDARNVNTGEKVDTVEGENRTWQTTDVQLTQEQLERMAEYYDEHNNYWNNTQNDDSDNGLGLPDWPDVPSLGPLDSIGKWVVAILGGTGVALVGYDQATKNDDRARQ